MNKKIFLFAVSLILFSILPIKPAYAYSIPDFGSCLNPQGELLASYDSGMHGIVGQGEASGSDDVYQSSENGVTQCMCPDSGNGIQTNWFKADKLSDSEIRVLKSKGWIYIATGSNWGLEDKAYFAKNNKYSCRRNAKVDTKGSILGLANTGDSQTIYVFVLSGAAFLITGLILRKFSKV